MGRSRQENERLDRLASEVKKGGGLPLPLFFSAILNELLDNGSADNARLTAIVNDVGGFKSKKVAETWGGPDHDAWEFLTSDLVHQLAHRGYVAKDDNGRWVIGEKFVPGVSLEVIPARKGLNVATDITAWSREEREARASDSKLQARVKDLIQQPRGKRHSPEVMSRLRKSAETHGTISRVIKAGDGRIVDGRHRYEIDPNWPSDVHKRVDGTPISTDAEILATMYEKETWEQGGRWNSKTLKDVELVLGELAKTNKLKRDRVEAELRLDVARSNLAIAKAVGVDDKTVDAVRQELENSEFPNSCIHRYGGAKGTGKPKHLADCWCGEGKTPSPKPKKPSLVPINADPALRQIAEGLWNRLDRKPTEDELMDEAKYVGYGRNFQRKTAGVVLTTVMASRPTLVLDNDKSDPVSETVVLDSPIGAAEEPKQVCPEYVCPAPGCGHRHP